MRVIKLDHRHNLTRKGYDWAFRFQGWDPTANKIENAVKKLEGYRWDSTYWGKPTGRNTGRLYYVGVKHESTITMVLLSLG